MPTIPAGSGTYVLSLIGGVGGSITMLSYNYWMREENMRGSRLPVVRARRHRHRLHLHGDLRRLDHADRQRRVLHAGRGAEGRRGGAAHGGGARHGARPRSDASRSRSASGRRCSRRCSACGRACRISTPISTASSRRCRPRQRQEVGQGDEHAVPAGARLHLARADRRLPSPASRSRSSSPTRSSAACSCRSWRRRCSI